MPLRPLSYSAALLILLAAFIIVIPYSSRLDTGGIIAVAGVTRALANCRAWLSGFNKLTASVNMDRTETPGRTPVYFFSHGIPPGPICIPSI